MLVSDKNPDVIILEDCDLKDIEWSRLGHNKQRSSFFKKEVIAIANKYAIIIDNAYGGWETATVWLTLPGGISSREGELHNWKKYSNILHEDNEEIKEKESLIKKNTPLRDSKGHFIKKKVKPVENKESEGVQMEKRNNKRV